MSGLEKLGADYDSATRKQTFFGKQELALPLRASRPGPSKSLFPRKMSYRKTHIKSKLRGIKPKKSPFKMVWVWVSLLCLVVILAGLYFILFYPGFQLKSINVSGNNKVPTQNLQNIISTDSNTGLISLLNIKVVSKSIFLINKNKITKDILIKYPEIKSLTLNKSLPQTLTLHIEERRPFGIYCANGTTNNLCYLIDQNGVVFEQQFTLPADATIVRQNMATGLPVAGQKVLQTNIATTIYKIQQSLKNNLQINITDALITSPIRMDVDTGKNWKIYFDLSPNFDIDSQLKKLGLLLNGGLSADSMKNLRYIDLRPKDRAIVCDNSTCGG